MMAIESNPMRRTPARTGGFTLIEVLVVFTLLALLLSIAVPRYLSVAGNSREKAREQNMATIRDALDKYKADQGSYPAALDDLVTKQYLRKVPVDPVSGASAWIPLSDPSNTYPGVYDIAAPTADMQTPQPLGGQHEAPDASLVAPRAVPTSPTQ